MNFQRDHGHRGHGAVRHGLYGGQPASSFQNAVTVLLLNICCSPESYVLIDLEYIYRLNRNGWVVLLLEKGGSRAFFSERRRLCRKTPCLSRRRQQVRCRHSRMMKVQAMLVMIATSFTERGLGEVDPWLADRRPHRWTFSANLEPRRLTTRQLSFHLHSPSRAMLCAQDANSRTRMTPSSSTCTST